MVCATWQWASWTGGQEPRGGLNRHYAYLTYNYEISRVDKPDPHGHQIGEPNRGIIYIYSSFIVGQTAEGEGDLELPPTCLAIVQHTASDPRPPNQNENEHALNVRPLNIGMSICPPLLSQLSSAPGSGGSASPAPSPDSTPGDRNTAPEGMRKVSPLAKPNSLE